MLVFLTCFPYYVLFRNRPIKLAWASAQIHCQCSVSEIRVDLPKSPQLSNAEVTTSGNETSFIPSKGGFVCMYGLIVIRRQI